MTAQDRSAQSRAPGVVQPSHVNPAASARRGWRRLCDLANPVALRVSLSWGVSRGGSGVCSSRSLWCTRSLGWQYAVAVGAGAPVGGGGRGLSDFLGCRRQRAPRRARTSELCFPEGGPHGRLVRDRAPTGGRGSTGCARDSCVDLGVSRRARGRALARTGAGSSIARRRGGRTPGGVSARGLRKVSHDAGLLDHLRYQAT